MGRLMSLGWIACKWLFCLCGMCGKILRGVVGAVPMCPPVSPSRGASIVHPPRTMRVFWYGNAAARPCRPVKGAFVVHTLAHDACILGMETPLRGRSGGHTGAAPTCFVWVDCV